MRLIHLPMAANHGMDSFFPSRAQLSRWFPAYNYHEHRTGKPRAWRYTLVVTFSVSYSDYANVK